MKPAALVLAALAALGALAGCVTPAAVDDAVAPAAAASAVPLDADGLSAKLATKRLYSTLTATSAAGFPVHAEVYLPDPASAVDGHEVPETMPAILLASPYNGAGHGEDIEWGYGPYDFLIERMLPRGYAVVVGDSSAMGGSGGCWDFMGPHDVASAVALVEAIAAQPWSDGRVGMFGLSYDGMTQIMAASQKPEALATIVPAAALTHAYAGLYQNGVHYGGGWMATTTAYTASGLTPPLANTDRYPGHVDSVARAPPCVVETTAHGNDPTGAYNAWYRERDFRASAAEVDIPVFVLQGFLDSAVKPDNLLPYWSDLPGPKKAWLGHWYHQYPVADNSGRTDLYLTLHRWFDHTLKGVPNGIDRELHVDVQDSQGRWRIEAAWPPADANVTTLHLAEGALQAEPGEGTASFGGPVDVPLRVARMDMGPDFTTGPLDAPLHIAGEPVLNVTLGSSRPGGQLIARLVDVGDGKERLVSQGAFNLQLHAGPESAKPLTPFQPVEVGFRLYPTDYLVPEGHELVLRLFAQAPDNWYNPDPWLAELEVAFGEGTRLALPLVERTDEDVRLVACGRPLRQVVDGCYDEDRKDAGVDA